MTSFEVKFDSLADCPSHDEVDESVREENCSRFSELLSLTDPHDHYPKKRDLQLPTSDSHGYKTIRDVGLYLGNTDTQFGIDYISLVFRFENFVRDSPKDWAKGPKDLDVHRGYGYWENSWVLNFGESDVYPSFEFWAKVHGTNRTAGFAINPSSVFFGQKSPFVAHVDETMKLLRYIYEHEISQWLVLPNPLEWSTLSRLDVSTDVDNVLDKQRLLKFVARYPQNRRAKTRVYMNPSGCWETVETRSKANGGMSVYDKSTQMGESGRLVRFESQMRTRNLKMHCPTLEHLNDEVLRRVFHKHFGNAVEAMISTQDGLLEGLLGDPKYRLRLVEFAGLRLLEKMGYFVELGTSRRTAYRRLDRMGVGDILAEVLNGIE